MNMNKLMTGAFALTVATSATLPMATNADTIEINGVTWTYTVNNAANKTVTLGGGNTSTRAIDTTESVDAADIPWVFTDETSGDTYKVTQVASYAFHNCTKLTGTLTFPSSVTSIGNYAFYQCRGLTGLKLGANIKTIGSFAFAICPNMVGDISDLTSVTSFGANAFDAKDGNNHNSKLYGHVRFNPSLTSLPTTLFRYVPITGVTLPDSLTSAASAVFQNTQIDAMWLKGSVDVDVRWFALRAPVEIVLAGQNTRCNNPTGDSFLGEETVCKLFIPATGNWLNLVTTSSPGVDVIYYGPDRDLDISIDEAKNTLNATTTSAGMLVKMLEAAPLFRSHFGLDTRISVTNAIDLTGVTITDGMLSGVTFDRLMFSVKTQSELNAILDTFPASTPLAIDPTGLTEDLTVAARWNVFVKSGEGYAVKKRHDGLMVIVK